MICVGDFANEDELAAIVEQSKLFKENGEEEIVVFLLHLNLALF